MRILLHACCGPCLLEPYDELKQQGHEVHVAYYNPNIHPVSEYEQRRDTLVQYAEGSGVSWLEMPYDVVAWMERVAPLAAQGAKRCRACYRLRLEAVAERANELGYEAIATTLSVSPWQDAEAIAEEARRAAEKTGLLYAGADYRERYAEATRRSRELGMYRQNYCGCVLSELEARREREQRRAERRATKEAKRAE